MSKQYRLKTKNMIRYIRIVVLLNISLLVLAYYMVTHQKEPPYYQFTPTQSGKPPLKRMQALRSRIVNKQALIVWAAEAASAAYTYDQANYKDQLKQVIAQYFTPAGGESFIEAFKESGVEEQLVSEQLLVTAVVQNTPALLKSGILLGRETWKIQLPLLVTYQTASQVKQSRYIVTMLIVRTPTTKDARGIGIEQLWVKRAG